MEELFSLNHLLRVMLSLLIVCSLAVIVIRQLAKTRGSGRLLTPKNGAKRRAVQIVERIALDRNNQLVLVQLAGEGVGSASGERILLSVSLAGVEFLGKVSQDGTLLVEQGQLLAEAVSKHEISTPEFAPAELAPVNRKVTAKEILKAIGGGKS